MSDGAEGVNGEGAGLAELHDRYDPWLRRRLRTRYGTQEAEDLVQEVWARMAGVAALDAVRHPKAFLLRVATNLASGQARRQAVAQRVLDAAPLEEDVAAEQVESVFFRQMILDLPQPLRDVFVLSRVSGLSNDQIAEQLGISRKTVEWRMTKALAICSAQLRR